MNRIGHISENEILAFQSFHIIRREKKSFWNISAPAILF